MTYEKCKVGDKVHHLITKENGVIKSVFSGTVFVCFGNPILGIATSPLDLGEGWL